MAATLDDPPPPPTRARARVGRPAPPPATLPSGDVSSRTAASSSPLRLGALYAAGDRAFASLFSRILVYTILFEDNERDLEFLDLGAGDRVLTIGGAGCGVAAMMGYRPAAIDVVDFNQKHLAVTALKVSAAVHLDSYDDLHQLLGRGRHPRAKAIIGALSLHMPSEQAAFWRRGWRMFKDDFYAHGLYTRNLNIVRPFWPVTIELLRSLNDKPKEERAVEMRALLSQTMKRPLLGALIRSPLSILAAGINYTQRERNLRAVGSTDVVDGVIDYATRVVQTDIERNWIGWHIATGSFNHDEPECLPLYLRPAFHERALGSRTEVRYWHDTILRRLADAAEETWSHFCLSDVPDWIDDESRVALFREIYRAAKPGARVIARTVEDSTIVDGLGCADRFRLVEPHSSLASAEERSRLYRRVNCYEIVK